MSKEGLIKGLSEGQLRKYRGKVGDWVNNPKTAKRWLLVQHGIFMARLADMIQTADYPTSAQMKDDLREFQEWAGTFAEMLDGYQSFIQKEKERKRSAEARTESAASESLPWRGQRSGGRG